jgi:hypothetical protein
MKCRDQTSNARYDLHSWLSDLSVSYDLGLSSEWALRPRAGLTSVRATRDGVSEAGGSAFALTVARDRHVAGFADAGLSFARSGNSAAPLRPFVSLGLRYQIKGSHTDAVAGYAGGLLGLTALGAARADLVGIRGGGSPIACRRVSTCSAQSPRGPVAPIIRKA